MSPLSTLSRDGRLLFAARVARMFGYGFLAVVLALYLDALGFDGTQIGFLLTLTLVGDTVISLWMSTHADRYGRRPMLVVGSLLILGAGLVFIATDRFVLLLVAATIGVISPSGYEVGPFLAIEQAALSQTVADNRRTGIFAWYNLVGSFATAAGSLTAGGIARLGQAWGLTPLASYRIVLAGYFWRLSRSVEAPQRAAAPSAPRSRFGVDRSAGVVLRLSGLFAMDAFGGGFVIQSMLAYWFYLRFGTNEAMLGAIFFGANLLAGVSALAASAIAARIGLVNTMVFTHLPSNVLLMLVPLMPTLPLAILVLLLRFSISQMDVPTRQSYTMAIVPAEERAAAAGITGTARSVGAAVAPVCAGVLLGNPALMNGLFFVAGGFKIVYDLLLLRSFRQVKPPEETGDS
ncbi:MAG: MFS transporter [candidate division NC10 bacterium]|nr:MFS transporter [candidate division NC10 bacterium]